MTDVTAVLNVADGSSSRPLDVDDFKAPATGSATEATLAALNTANHTDLLALATALAAVLAKQPATPSLEHATAGSPASSRLSDGTTYIGSTAQRLHVDDGGSSLTVDGTVTADRASSTATLSNVASSATSGTLLASNASRKAFTIFNDSTAVLYVKFGTTASATSYTVAIAAGGYYESPMWNYTGRVDGVWASANGSARLTELS